MRTVLGIVFSSANDHRLNDLTAHRCMGSVPFGGRYRLIDFVLSNLANAQIEDVGVVTKSNYQSLMDHLGSGREWDMARKHGGMIILPPFGRAEGSGIYRGKIEAFAGIMGYIKAKPAKYVLASNCDTMANIDFGAFVRSHIDSGADISLMYKRVNMAERETQKCTTLVLDSGGAVRDILINPEMYGKQNVYMDIMMISAELLEHIVSDAYSRNQFSFTKDVLQSGVGLYKINAYEYDGYASRFDSMRAYFDASMRMLETDVRRQLFPRERPIYTKLRDEAPTVYGLNANVRNSLLADGCTIEGEVENSVLFRGVKIGKGVKVKNSIIMQNTQIGIHSNLECVITDKDVVINDGRMIMGHSTYPVFIAKGSNV